MRKKNEDQPLHQVATLNIVIKSSDIDGLGHVNNTVYLQWVQEVAAFHWKNLAGAKAEMYTWVVRRHEIDYLSPALPGDDLRAITWVGDTDGLRSSRHVQIKTADGRLLAEARSVWCLVDSDSGRVRRLSEEVKTILGK